jgi:hypothetical protein
MSIGDTLAVGYGGGRRKIPIREGYLKILAPTLKKYCVVSPTKGTFDLALDPRYGVHRLR